MSFSKLPYLVVALWPIIVVPDHLPVLGIVPFVVMSYLFRVFNQWCMAFVLCFCGIFLFWFAFKINLAGIFFISSRAENHLIVVINFYCCLQKLLEKGVLLCYQKKVQILVFWKVYNDTWYKTPSLKLVLFCTKVVIEGVKK